MNQTLDKVECIRCGEYKLSSVFSDDVLPLCVECGIELYINRDKPPAPEFVVTAESLSKYFGIPIERIRR